jgi:hypothetical protein
MKTLIKAIAPALVASLALGAAMPAQARPTPVRTDNIADQIADLERAVNRNDNRDRISEREARGLRQEVRQLRWQYNNYRRNGLNNWEYRNLQNRIDNIRGRLHHERNDRNGRRY